MDLSKRVYQVHAVDRAGKPVMTKAMNVERFFSWCTACISRILLAELRITGIGPITASALVASVGDFAQFRNARQFAAWLGLVPSQNSTGGKASLGGITKPGDDYLRTLLIQGAKSAVTTAGKRSDRISQWPVQLHDRVGWQKAAVALANRNARILNQSISPAVAHSALSGLAAHRAFFMRFNVRLAYKPWRAPMRRPSLKPST